MNYLVEMFQLDTDLKIVLKEKLGKRFFNNFKKKFDKLSKNRKNYDNFEDTYTSWLGNHFHFSFEANKRDDSVKTGKIFIFYVYSILFYFLTYRYTKVTIFLLHVLIHF